MVLFITILINILAAGRLEVSGAAAMLAAKCNLYRFQIKELPGNR